MNIFDNNIRYRWYTIHKELFSVATYTHYVCYTSFMSDTVMFDVHNPLIFNIKKVRKYAI